jgi:hypothetical protein
VRTGTLIDLLAADVAPQWSVTRLVLLAVVGGVVVAGGAFLLTIGCRPDISQAVQSVRFLFKFVVTMTLTVGAAGAALTIGRPGATIERWGWMLAAVPALLLIAVALELIAVPERAWMGHLIGQNARACLMLIPLLATGPFACLFLALRHGAPTAPRLAGMIAGVAASGIAATFYAANCTDDSPLFVATWYPIATFMVAAGGYVAGDRFLRW